MANQLNVKDIEKLFELGAHLGHKKSRLDPKAKKNVYAIMNGTSIIDLTKTVEQLKKAKNFLVESKSEGKVLLVVGTKKVASPFIREYCTKQGLPYISSKWLPGLLTNFETLIKNVQKLKTLKTGRDTGEWESLVKHERVQLGKEISKLERLYGGLETLSKRPDVLVIIDAKKEKNALKEAQSYKIPVVSLLDTNSNPEKVDYPVVANDDSTQVIEYIMNELLTAYTEAKTKEIKEEVKPTPAPAVATS
jgi:small subunit ribosomal protein S2